MAKKREQKTVLIIEDEADVRTFTARVLELEGYRVLQAEDGGSGIRLARENRVALVLLDLRLPDVDGWAVLAEIKGKPELSAIPVIVFTASNRASQRDRAFSAGAYDLLVKPLGAADLVKTVNKILRKMR